MKRLISLVSDEPSFRKVFDPNHIQNADVIEAAKVTESASGHSLLLRRVLKSGFSETQRKEVKLPFSSETLQRLADFLELEEENNPGRESQRQRVEFQFPIGSDALFSLECAFYTETWPWFNLCKKMVLSTLADIPSFDGLPEAAVKEIVADANLNQLCQLEDLALVAPVTLRAEWAGRPPVQLPPNLLGNWPDSHPKCAVRGDFESMHRGKFATRLHLTKLKISPAFRTELIGFVCISDEKELSRDWIFLLEGFPSLRQLSIRLQENENEKIQSVRLCPHTSSRLTHLELQNARLSKKSASLLRLQVLVLSARETKLRESICESQLSVLHVLESCCTLNDLGLSPDAVLVPDVCFSGSRIASIRIGGTALMPDGRPLSILRKLESLIVRLDLSRSNIHDDTEVQEFFRHVCSGPLEILDVSDNKLQQGSFGAVLCSSTKLRELIFEGNRLGSGLALPDSVLAKALRVLNVSRNFVPPEAAQRFIADAIQTLPHLDRLVLSRQSSWTREFTSLRDRCKGLPMRVEIEPIDLETEDQIAGADDFFLN